MAPIQATNMILSLGVLLVSIAAVAIVTLLASTVAGRSLKPLERLSAHAAALNSSDLSLRLPQNGLPRELHGLASAFNGALERLEGAYLRLASFNADVAHELRTPLGNLIGQTQVALSRPRSAEELEE
ncbi:hypothetical protein LTR94_032888, partial [Friedmanniomyces endolithicus]